MRSPSLLIDSAKPLVLDTSVAINLTATEDADRILRALPSRLIVADEVVSELESGRNRGRENAEQVQGLIESSLVETAAMGSMALDHFEKLVAGSARGTLGDGEAATIAIALEIDGIPLLDDHKACGICDKRYPKLSYGCSIDIFAHAEVGRALGTSGLALAVFNALMKARMRVLPQHERWVVNLIGPERAAQCGSLSRSARSSFDIP